MPVDHRPYCAAIARTEGRYQVVHATFCQNRALTTIDGVPLCGSHINAAGERPIMVRSMFKLADTPRRLDVIDVRKR